VTWNGHTTALDGRPNRTTAAASAKVIWDCKQREGKGTIVTTSSGAGIAVFGVADFTNGVTNSGVINALGSSGHGSGIQVESVAIFSGGIVNNAGGAIAAKTADGIHVSGVSSFFDGVTNRGTIRALGSAGSGILVESVTTFSGGIVNSAGGNISAKLSAIAVFNDLSVSGGVVNKGTIVGGGVGAINVGFVSNFAGGVVNSGTIRGLGAGAIVVGVNANFSGDVVNASAGVISALGYGMALSHQTLVGQVSSRC
jgi:hypothetical protein